MGKKPKYVVFHANKFECEICSQNMTQCDFDNSDICPQCLEGE